MPLSLTVTPGTNFSDGDAVTAADLNLAADPDVSIPDNSITYDLLDSPDVIDGLGAALRGTPYLTWGSFQQQNMASASVSCTAAVKTYPITGWWVTPTGAAVTASYQPLTSTTADSDDSRSALKLLAGGALTLLQFGTWIPSGLAQQLGDAEARFSIYIRNRTGTAFTPHLKVYTASTLDDPSSIGAAVDDVTGTSCADSDWSRQVFALTPTAHANWSKGVMLVLEITCGGGVLDTGSDFILVSDAQLEPGTTETAFIRVPPALPQVPPGTLFPYAGSTAPAGWLLCDGSLVAKAKYPALYAVCGDSYGMSGASFNLPDFRGRVPVGANAASLSPERMDVGVTIVSSATDTLTVAYGDTAALRLGMSAHGHADLTGQTIIALTPTTIQLSASVGSGVSGAVYFSKLGGANARTLGSAGNGMSSGRKRVRIEIAGCTVTNGSARIVPPGTAATDKIQGIAKISQGMLLSDSAAGFAAGTTVAGFSFWNGTTNTSQCEIVASANYGGSTGTVTLYAELAATEADEYLTQRAAEEDITLYDCEWNNGAATLYTGDYNTRVRPGMLATHVSGGGAGFPAGTPYVVAYTGANINLSSNFTNTASTPQVVRFASGSTLRATAQTPDTLPAQVVNYIIKT